jgi:hypothetical protein
MDVRTRHASQLQTVFEVQDGIRDLHPFLERVFPIALVDEGRFLIYDCEPGRRRYAFVREAPTPMPIPRGVRAAFPLESYGGRMACVISDDVFAEPDGVVTIFHEFVHCQQGESCEPRLKQRLGVARRAQAAGDPMWELEHPFPYTATNFVGLYEAFLDTRTLEAAEAVRGRLRRVLEEQDHEYLVWQEWKEGFARFIENRIRGRLGLPENHGGRVRPFDRVAFYAGGAHLIGLLGARDAGTIVEIERLFERMLAGRDAAPTAA